MRYEVCDMDSHIIWPYQIADHHCRITWMYDKDYLHYILQTQQALKTLLEFYPFSSIPPYLYKENLALSQYKTPNKEQLSLF